MAENFPYGSSQSFEKCLNSHFLNHVLQFRVPHLAYLKRSYSKVTDFIAFLTV